jgi:hypothetical protein
MFLGCVDGSAVQHSAVIVQISRPTVGRAAFGRYVSRLDNQRESRGTHSRGRHCIPRSAVQHSAVVLVNKGFLTDLGNGRLMLPLLWIQETAYSGENDHLFRAMPITQTG